MATQANEFAGYEEYQPATQPSAQEIEDRKKAASEGMSPLDAAVAKMEATKTAEVQKFEMHQRQAKLFAASGLFSAVKDKTMVEAIAAYFTLIEIGEGMGFTPAQSVMGIDVIQGRPAVSAQLRAARMQQMGYSWQIEWLDSDKGECEGCRLWLFFRGKAVMERNNLHQVNVTYARHDAELMLTTMYKDDPKFPGDYKKRIKTRCSILEKENWQMSPRNMYFARAVTNLQRFYVPAAISANVLSTEEVRDGVIEPLAEIPQETQAQVLERKLQDIKRDAPKSNVPEEIELLWVEMGKGDKSARTIIQEFMMFLQANDADYYAEFIQNAIAEYGASATLSTLNMAQKKQLAWKLWARCQEVKKPAAE